MTIRIKRAKAELEEQLSSTFELNIQIPIMNEIRFRGIMSKRIVTKRIECTLPDGRVISNMDHLIKE